MVGLSFPGCPGFPHFGHNDKVAWCVTHAQADYQDIFIEKFNTDDGVSYEFEGDRKPANVRREVIKVRGADSVEVELVSTHHGPIIAGGPSKGHGLAFRYTATADINLGMQSVRKMLDAGTTDQMDESMREWVDPCNNLLFADVQGNIAYLNRGQVPVRSMANAWLPVPGWTGEHEWQGNIPFKELPRSKNPDTGFIVTANNRIIGSDYPHYIALSYASEYRARRILDRLKGLDDATVDDMASMHAERTSIPALIFLDIIGKVQPQASGMRTAVASFVFAMSAVGT